MVPDNSYCMQQQKTKHILIQYSYEKPQKKAANKPLPVVLNGCKNNLDKSVFHRPLICEKTLNLS